MIGAGYASTRRADPRIARVIRTALGDAASVVNIGAGSGSYEPTDLRVVPVEPSETMIRQRPTALPPALIGTAGQLPLAAQSVDAALAVLAVHHWRDRPAAFAEIRRVARRRGVFFTHDPDATFGWLDDYFPGLAGSRYPRLAEFDVLGSVTVEPVPVPADCRDGFTAAYWQRPDAYLEEAVRANMSTFALLDERVVADGVTRLSRDLADRSWHRRHASLLILPELDVGYRLVVAELT
ncbi:MAG TPA: class I SAM-dependent methyltransferase [Gaiellaceae bacterium]|nr:class I SAM-dependent methyltransferase [Gaiellaceae bacterium]